MKHFITAICTVLFCSAVYCATEEAKTVPPSPAPTDIYAKLEEPFRFDCPEAKTLGAVLEIISKETGIATVIQAGNGITRDTPAKLRLPIVLPLKEALRYLEKQLGIKWIAKDGVLHVSPRDANGDGLFRHAYYVGDLLRVSSDELRSATAGQAKHVDFEPIIDYIKTMVTPAGDSDSKLHDIMSYEPTLSLVVRATEETHAQIVSLLANLRQYNALQIEIETQVRPLANVATVTSAPRLIVFSGEEAILKLVNDGESLVQVAPKSGQPIPLAWQAQNKPISMVVPAKAKITLQAKAMKQRGRDVVKVTMRVDGKAPTEQDSVTQTFYASPIVQEEEIMTGFTPVQPVTFDATPVVAVYEVDELLVDKSNAEPLIDLIKSVVQPYSWENGNIVYKDNRLVVVQSEEVHHEIVDLLQQLQALDDIQIGFDVVFEHTETSKSATIFNGQEEKFDINADQDQMVSIKPAESALLSKDVKERQRKLRIVVPKGAKSLAVRGVAENSDKIRLSAFVDGEMIKEETFLAQPIIKHESVLK